MTTLRFDSKTNVSSQTTVHSYLLWSYCYTLGAVFTFFVFTGIFMNVFPFFPFFINKTLISECFCQQFRLFLNTEVQVLADIQIIKQFIGFIIQQDKESLPYVYTKCGHVHGYHTWGATPARPTLDSITRTNNNEAQDSVNDNQGEKQEDIRQCPYCKDVSDVGNKATSRAFSLKKKVPQKRGFTGNEVRKIVFSRAGGQNLRKSFRFTSKYL